jgi:hypothetical protein
MLPEHLRREFLSGEDILMAPTPLKGLRQAWHTLLGIGDHHFLEAVLISTVADLPIKNAARRTFTYCTLVAGGTYVSQYRALSGTEADSKWLASHKPWRTKLGASLTGPVLVTQTAAMKMFEEVGEMSGVARFDFQSTGPSGTSFRVSTAD